jgi:hypothetical protein
MSSDGSSDGTHSDHSSDGSATAATVGRANPYKHRDLTSDGSSDASDAIGQRRLCPPIKGGTPLPPTF